MAEIKDLFKKITVLRWEEGKDEPSALDVVLRKWSPFKLLTLFRDVEEIGQALGDDFSLQGTMTAPQLARMIHSVGEKAVRAAASLIVESIQKPKELKAEDVLAWDLDDFLVALTAIIDMNFAESTRKNFGGLRDAFTAVTAGVREAPAGPRLLTPAKNSTTAPVGA